jgi:MFS family permease
MAEAGIVLFLVGTVVAGVAVGAVFLGSLAIANRLAPEERRAQVMSTFYVACYSGLVVPVIGVGVLSGAVGIVPAVLGFSVLLAALCLFSLARTVISLAPDRVGSSDLSVR